MKAEQHSF